MAKKDIPAGVEGHSLGSRTQKEHGGSDAWHLGGRQDEDIQPFDAAYAAQRAAEYAARQQQKGK